MWEKAAFTKDKKQKHFTQAAMRFSKTSDMKGKTGDFRQLHINDKERAFQINNGCVSMPPYFTVSQ